jgi:hypothetical protein
VETVEFEKWWKISPTDNHSDPKQHFCYCAGLDSSTSWYCRFLRRLRHK